MAVRKATSRDPPGRVDPRGRPRQAAGAAELLERRVGRRHVEQPARSPTASRSGRKDRMCKDLAMASRATVTRLVTAARHRTASWCSRCRASWRSSWGCPTASSRPARSTRPGPAPAPTRRAGPRRTRCSRCTLDDEPVMTSAGYQVTPTHPHSVLATADTIVIPGIIDRHAAGEGTLPADLADLLATARPGVRWVSICTGAFVLAGPGCSTDWRRRPTGRTPSTSAGCSPPSGSTRTCSTSTTATSSRRPATRRGSTCCCTSCAATSAPTPPTGSPAVRSSRRGGRAGRPSSSSDRSPRPATRAPGRRARGRSTTSTSRSRSRRWPPGRG